MYNACVLNESSFYISQRDIFMETFVHGEQAEQEEVFIRMEISTFMIWASKRSSYSCCFLIDIAIHTHIQEVSRSHHLLFGKDSVTGYKQEV